MAEFCVSSAEFERFRRLIHEQAGINFTDTNRPILESRLRESLKQEHNGRKLETVSEFYEFITSNHEALRGFLAAVTTNQTSFFRNKPQFEALRAFVIPEIVKEKKKEGNYNVKVWSAGCSTGEEPYTIAMVLAETLPAYWKFDIVASDLNLKCLMSAKEGFYGNDHISGVPEEYLAKYFEKMEGGYKIRPLLKERIRFDYHNLNNDSQWRGMDIVFCRNVLIYFDEEVQIAVINRFYQSMAANSYLFIGHSESLLGLKTRFDFVKTQWAPLYAKNAAKKESE